ncbi:MAG: hypothetical protein A2504_14050 [Bdellovibrionales bacterium RIFOXYD12_FULL_39_22]|nr:MAG: hypothetical protein A2385_04485 [Bdellovibrionales bacterium RIFOXYB1_FULL_39_21]OFZ43405.1 MAG: hypothetical protein A2485_13000 [Bdellovibrionales bacterium RIFOXYC12_FULL_39_17]OFZ46948.1 MAG: hypothetical protein A2404_00060 [Bdellovibrionales bacterium RIFOXYC1_FULL_39_130]OFZ71455.1 MAG: hypothetical protein A2451_12580 [Bdellovibrionales bacterium RIFOXYC2_FULL_39_8]OFZ76145.1 MAG: hypothetical protein A2560_07310 [Bdellovibrionales bacterium RIFOXYD1_FULL_39_84]OFZ94380.1 MAG:
MNGLLVVERIILESLQKKGKNIFEIEIDTHLDHNLLANLLPNLVMKNIVTYKNGIYFLNNQEKHNWLVSINQEENIKEEIKDIFSGLISSYFKKEINERPCLKVKKIWLTAKEEKILDAHLHNLEEFVRNIDQDKGRDDTKNKLHEKRLIFWGYSTYSKVVSELLDAV